MCSLGCDWVAVVDPVAAGGAAAVAGCEYLDGDGADSAAGHPTLSLIGAIGVALTVGLRKGGVLLSLLVLPLYIPVLIFATAAIDAASMGMPIDGYLAILGAMLAGSITLAPFATAAALRVSVH